VGDPDRTVATVDLGRDAVRLIRAVAGLPLVTSALELADAISIGTGAVVAQTGILAALTVGIAVRRPYRSLPISEAIGRDAVVREPLSALVDADLLGPDGLPDESTIEIEGAVGKRYFDVSVSQVRGDTAVEAGYAVALRDVTDERIRGQRLEVLGRVLRHNARNGMTAVYAMADAIGENGDAAVRRSPELVASVCEHLLSYATENAAGPIAVTVEREGATSA
jgi:hypothetical protein